MLRAKMAQLQTDLDVLKRQISTERYERQENIFNVGQCFYLFPILLYKDFYIAYKQQTFLGINMEDKFLW